MTKTKTAPPARPIKIVKPLNWTPVRKGAIYCAPACGGNCTWAAYQQAVRESNALAKRLGAGWTPRVWENLGWHYAAVCGPVQVYADRHRPDGPLRYSVLIGKELENPAGGLAIWTDPSRHNGAHASPEEALRRAVGYMASVVEHHTRVLHAALRAAGIRPAAT